MSRSVAAVTSWGGLIPLLASIDIHGYRIARSWARVCGWQGMENAWCSHSDRDCTGTGWSGSRCSVGQLECFVGSAILVDILHCFIPIFWRGIGGASIGHHSDSILDFQVQSFLELYYSGFGICVSCFRYQLQKFIKVVIDRLGLLIVTGRLQFVDGCNVGVSQVLNIKMIKEGECKGLRSNCVVL